MVWGVALTLVTGPANAAKAGVVFERLRSQLADDPLLVVPTQADVGHYQRELAADGIGLGAEVVTFTGLIRALARAVGVTGPLLGDVARERVVWAAIKAAPLERLAASAASAGFGAVVGDACRELQRELITPERLGVAVRRWAAAGGGARCEQVRELAMIYGAYRRKLEALGVRDAESDAWAVLDALRLAPGAWGRRPVLLYGFDNLTRTELDAVETLAVRAEADVVVTLAYEPGRAAFAGRATTMETLRPLASHHVQVQASETHYAAAARAALHHLERGLFEGISSGADPAGAVRLLEAGGERGEAELVGAGILASIAAGTPPEEIAVLVRGADAQNLMSGVLESYGIEVAGQRRITVGDSRLGAGMLALARASEPDGTAEDLLRWLRTPGRVPDLDPVDALEAQVMRDRITGAGEARRLWSGASALLERLDAVARATASGPLALLEVLAAEAHDIWTAPLTRSAAVLGPGELASAQTATEIRAAIAELSRLAGTDPALLPAPQDALDALAGVGVDISRGESGVLIADPLEVRARRFASVFVCGLQDGDFPRRPQPHSLVADDDRRALALLGGVALPPRGPSVDDERYLFYASCSRPEAMLTLAWQSSNEEGDPRQRSPFVDEVVGLFGPQLWDERRRRLLAQVTWSRAAAPTAGERRRARVAERSDPEPPGLLAPGAPTVLALLAARQRESARGLETFAACGVRWLVEALLRPKALEPDADALRRGSLAHAVLEETLRGLMERPGSAALSPETLPAALDVLQAVVARRGASGRWRGTGEQTMLRAVAADAERYLREEAATGPAFAPAHLEWSFGGDQDAAAALVLADGTRVSGRVDRIDIAGRRAIVRDYKHRTVHPAAKWLSDGRLQAGLYALAAREHLGLEPVAAVYQPLAGPELRPRGILRDDVDGARFDADVLSDADFEATLAAVAEAATDAARALRSGAVRACPQRCSSGGCQYPTICRAGADDGESGDAGGDVDEIGSA